MTVTPAEHMTHVGEHNAVNKLANADGHEKEHVFRRGAMTMVGIRSWLQ
jgi:hypothetical protein